MGFEVATNYNATL